MLTYLHCQMNQFIKQRPSFSKLEELCFLLDACVINCPWVICWGQQRLVVTATVSLIHATTDSLYGKRAMLSLLVCLEMSIEGWCTGCASYCTVMTGKSGCLQAVLLLQQRRGHYNVFYLFFEPVHYLISTMVYTIKYKEMCLVNYCPIMETGIHVCTVGLI